MPGIPKHRRVLAQNIRAYRKQAGLTQERLAEQADLHPVFISMLERGVKTVSLDALVRVAKALNVSPVDLLKGI